mgnify:CR=1 FL=1
MLFYCLVYFKHERGFVAKKRKPKEYERLDADEIAKALGAKRITDPKEIEKLKKKHFPKSKK